MNSHLLQKHGILKKFHINRKFTKPELKLLYEHLGISKEEVLDPAVKEKIDKTLQVLCQLDHQQGNIPGMINTLPNIPNASKNISQLFNISISIVKLLSNENLTPQECMFVLTKVIKELNLDSFKPSDEGMP